MKAVQREIEEIKRLEEAKKKSTSIFLKKDYSKRIERIKKDLQVYCRYRGYDYSAIMNGGTL